MKLLIKNVRVFPEGSATDILLEDGVIQKMGGSLNADAELIDGNGGWISPGWFDFGAQFWDPGFEFKEDIHSGLRAAESGGYTGVATLPNTYPVVQTKESVAYLKRSAQDRLCQIYPLAAVTLGCEGEDMTEMLDLYQAGAAGFTDGLQPIWNTDIMLKTLLYLKQRDAVLLDRPRDIHLSKFGQIAEGEMSAYLGLKGVPGLAEWVIVNRNLDLLRYTGGKLHFTHISTLEAVELIKKAKQEGLKVTCDVPVYLLKWNESVLDGFQSNFKVEPPLQSEEVRKGLIAAVIDGTIDGITAAHLPQDQDSKEMEFDLAEFGMIGFQTVLPILVSLREELPLEKSIPILYQHNRRCLGLVASHIAEGQEANFTLFDTAEKWEFNSATNASKSVNSSLFGKELVGKVKGVVQGDNYLLF